MADELTSIQKESSIEKVQMREWPFHRNGTESVFVKNIYLYLSKVYLSIYWMGEVYIQPRQGSLACCSPWDWKELDTTEWLNWFNHNQENAHERPSEMLIIEIPWWSSGWDSMLSPLRMQVQLLVNELRAHKPRLWTTTKFKKKRNADGIHTGQECTMESRFITYFR